MELKQLEYFLTVSKLKSFTKAAEQLYISQPSVTTAIRRIEDYLGIILFERNKKHAFLTPDGEIFYSHITIVIYDVSNATQKAAELKNLNSGNINLGISPIRAYRLPLSSWQNFAQFIRLCRYFPEDGSYSIKNLIEEERIRLGLVISTTIWKHWTSYTWTAGHGRLSLPVPPIEKQTIHPSVSIKKRFFYCPQRKLFHAGFFKNRADKAKYHPPN